MKVLVTVASKHGATAEIGDLVAKRLRAAGHTVDLRIPESVETLEGYDAVVAGSAVYAGHWLDPARRFIERHADALRGLPAWLFSSGPIGDPPMPEGDPPAALELAERIGARDHRTFAGRLDRNDLGFVERAITRALRAPDGDFRDPTTIEAWGDAIASALEPTVTGA